jgi:hypothetical protein
MKFSSSIELSPMIIVESNLELLYRLKLKVSPQKLSVKLLSEGPNWPERGE